MNSPSGENPHQVREVFTQSAPNYDLMNDLMSVGMHRLWKRRLAATVLPRAPRAPFHVMDLAAGTGDITRLLLARGASHVTMVDPSPSMLTPITGAHAVQAPAETLPFASRTFDACTIAFGVRNFSHRSTALTQVLRTLRIGGVFACLEFTPPTTPLSRTVHRTLANTIPRLGKAVMGNADPYHYLMDSIERFPPPSAFCQLITQAGFGRVRYLPLFPGMVALFTARKLA